jgi:hypothetical protein
MTGSHEVRGSIPLGSTNTFKILGPPGGGPKLFSPAESIENAPDQVSDRIVDRGACVDLPASHVHNRI